VLTSFTREKTLDKLELAAYLKEVPATLAGHDVRVLAANGSHEDLEGPSTEGTVILEFRSIEAAKAWYNGSPYREVREHRLKGATSCHVSRRSLESTGASPPLGRIRWSGMTITKPTVGRCLLLGLITPARGSAY
jgi:uncharacterized protein (DUF1330 family)